jgi:hypothetical protein
VLPKLRECAMKYNTTPRLTIVASDAHEQASPSSWHSICEGSVY